MELKVKLRKCNFNILKKFVIYQGLAIEMNLAEVIIWDI